MYIVGAVDNGEKWLINRGNWRILAWENLAEKEWVSHSKTRQFVHLDDNDNKASRQTVDKRTQFLPRALNQLYTKFPQYLSIKFLPDFGDLFADSEVKLDSLFNFVDRMNSRGVIFAAELLSDARKTHV